MLRLQGRQDQLSRHNFCWDRCAPVGTALLAAIAFYTVLRHEASRGPSHYFKNTKTAAKAIASGNFEGKRIAVAGHPTGSGFLPLTPILAEQAHLAKGYRLFAQLYDPDTKVGGPSVQVYKDVTVLNIEPFKSNPSLFFFSEPHGSNPSGLPPIAPVQFYVEGTVVKQHGKFFLRAEKFHPISGQTLRQRS